MFLRLAAHGIRISTHAPVKGATPFTPHLNTAHFISTHAPVKGATTFPLLVGSEIAISTHAPVKGATIAFPD